MMVVPTTVNFLLVVAFIATSTRFANAAASAHSGARLMRVEDSPRSAELLVSRPAIHVIRKEVPSNASAEAEARAKAQAEAKVEVLAKAEAKAEAKAKALATEQAKVAAYAQAKAICSPASLIENEEFHLSKSHQSGVIVYLATRHDDLKDLVYQVLPNLYRQFLHRWKYPVVIFVPSAAMRTYDSYSYAQSPNRSQVESKLRNTTLDGTRTLADGVTVAEFDVEFPASIHWTKGTPYVSQSTWATPYLHMNQFFSKVMYEHPALQDYRYYMRLDTDLVFTSDAELDPFCMARETGKKFMYLEKSDSAFTEGMGEWMQAYVQNHGLSPVDNETWYQSVDAHHRFSYKGYFGLGDLQFFRSPQVQALAKAFNEDGRIYTHRWSDQVYYVFALSLFLNRSEVEELSWLHASHKGCMHSGQTKHPECY